MVFGFFMAVVLMQGIGNFIGNSFGTFASGMNANYLSGPVTFLTMWFMIGGIMVVAIHKVFGLITWLPDNVMRWVGQQVQNLGEGQDEGRTRTIFAGAATSGGGAASQAAGKVARDHEANKAGKGGGSSDSTGVGANAAAKIADKPDDGGKQTDNNSAVDDPKPERAKMD